MSAAIFGRVSLRRKYQGKSLFESRHCKSNEAPHRVATRCTSDSVFVTEQRFPGLRANRSIFFSRRNSSPRRHLPRGSLQLSFPRYDLIRLFLCKITYFSVTIAIVPAEKTDFHTSPLCKFILNKSNRVRARY